MAIVSKLNFGIIPKWDRAWKDHKYKYLAWPGKKWCKIKAHKKYRKKVNQDLSQGKVENANDLIHPPTLTRWDID